jgi:hypothetical protein
MALVAVMAQFDATLSATIPDGMKVAVVVHGPLRVFE